MAEPNAARVAPRCGGGRADPVDGLGEQTLERREAPSSRSRTTSPARSVARSTASRNSPCDLAHPTSRRGVTVMRKRTLMLDRGALKAGGCLLDHLRSLHPRQPGPPRSPLQSLENTHAVRGQQGDSARADGEHAELTADTSLRPSRRQTSTPTSLTARLKGPARPGSAENSRGFAQVARAVSETLACPYGLKRSVPARCAHQHHSHRLIGARAVDLHTFCTRGTRRDSCALRRGVGTCLTTEFDPHGTTPVCIF